MGSKAQVDFLVHEGQIGAQAIVRHIEPDIGFGLKFITVRDTNRVRLVNLMRRLGSAQEERRTPTKPEQQRLLSGPRKIVGFHLDANGWRSWSADTNYSSVVIHRGKVRIG